MASEIEERISFSLSQQAKVDELINKAFAKGLRKGVKETQAELEKLRAEVDELKAGKNKFSFWRR